MTEFTPAPRAETRAGDTTRRNGQYTLDEDGSNESNRYDDDLRTYQRKMLAELRRALPSGPIMATLATGGGKTAVAARLAAGYRRVLFLAPTRSVVNQAPKEFRNWGVLAANASDGKWDTVLSSNAKVVVASYILAGNRLKQRSSLSQFDLLIVDEAHHAADGKSVITRLVHDANKSGLHVLGLTATCWRLSVHEGFSRTWRKLLQFEDWNALLRAEHLANCDLHFLAPEEVIRGGKPGSHGEYTNSGILELNKRRPLFTQGAVDWWASVARHKTQDRWLFTICYAVGQKHAVNVARRFKEKGACVGLILSDKDQLKRAPSGIERDTNRAIKLFRERKLDVLVNVQMVTEGFDAPASECVLVLRPTMSVALWLQICGRGSRRDCENGKTSLLLLDATDNALRLGHPLYPRRWQLTPRGIKPNSASGRQRYCEPKNRRSCGAQMTPAKRICPTCLERQGEACPVCGRFTLWKGYEESDSEICPRCELARRLKWQKLWRRLPYGAWWQPWKESWVAPDIPERLPPDSPYVHAIKDGIGSPFYVKVRSNNPNSDRGNFYGYSDQAFDKEKAMELGYGLYHRHKREKGL